MHLKVTLAFNETLQRKSFRVRNPDFLSEYDTALFIVLNEGLLKLYCNVFCRFSFHSFPCLVVEIFPTNVMSY